MPELRIVFMGTGDIAIPAFESLLGNGLCALVTQPDKPVGRKQVLTPPRIKELALEHGIDVLQPERAGDGVFLDALRRMEPDLIVVMAYGQILTQALLDIARISCINVHASLLPKYRGAACIQAAIDAGEAETGVTVMHVVKKLDSGDVILQQRLPILPGETGGQLHDRLAAIAPEALQEAIGQLADGSAARVVQDESKVSYVPKLLREHGEIDWSLSAAQLERRVRAYHPWPGTSTAYKKTKGKQKGRMKRLKVFPPTEVVECEGGVGEVVVTEGDLVVGCGEGALKLSEVQPDGGRRMSVAEFLRGQPVRSGDKFC